MPVLAPPRLSNEQLQPEVVGLLTPNREQLSSQAMDAYAFNENRLRTTPGFSDIQDTVAKRRVGEAAVLPYLTYGGVLDTWRNTQGSDETHRMLTPRILEIMHYDDTRKAFIAGINESANRSTARLMKEAARNKGVIDCDAVVIGSGPHGAASVARLRREHPEFRIIVVEGGDFLGGQWSNNGPEAAFAMNSRVRRPNNGLPNTPRTPGNINPQGRYSTIELADIVRGNYAWNIEQGYAAAINTHQNVSAAMVGTRCEYIIDRGTSAEAVVTVNGEAITIRANVAISAPGIRQVSTLAATDNQRSDPRYYTSQDIYRLFGNHEGRTGHRPLAAFAGRAVIGIGGGDSLLTGLEALLGNLPSTSYGPYGVGRDSMQSYDWVGAPGQNADEIAACLRSRYQNGILQAAPKNASDRGAVINPVPGVRATSFVFRDGLAEVRLNTGQSVYGDVILDHTNEPRGSYGPNIIEARADRSRESAVVQIGPGANDLQLPPNVLRTIQNLGIGANIVALWATMDITERRAELAGNIALRNAIIRNLTRPTGVLSRLLRR